MKKQWSLFIASLFLLFISANIQAQTSIGIKAGGSLSDVHIKNNILDFIGLNSIFEATPGFHGGLSIHTQLHEDIQLVSDLLYAQKGFKATAPFISQANATITFHYVSLPVMVYYEALDRISLGAGAEISYLVEARSKALGASLDISDAWKEVDFGLNFGIKFDATENIWIEGRYNLGLSPLMNLGFTGNTGLPIDTALKMTNRVAQVSIGYRL
jgi:opacity protein-like surface antigen